MNLTDILAQQQKLVAKAKTGMATRKIAAADLAQPVDPKLLTIDTVFANVKGTAAKTALVERYKSAIAPRQTQIAQVRNGVATDATLKAAFKGPADQAAKNVLAKLRESGALASLKPSARADAAVKKKKGD